MIQRLAARFGWRGLWLMLVGFMWMMFGVGVYLEPAPSRSWVLVEYLPSWVHAAGWTVTGLVAIWQGSRGPSRDDSLGHIALFTMPFLRLGSFLLAWLVYMGATAAEVAAGVDVPPVGFAQGWYPALVWSLLSVMLALAASWPNPTTPIPRPPAESCGVE